MAILVEVNISYLGISLLLISSNRTLESFSFCQGCAVKSEQLLRNEIEPDFYPECFIIIWFFVDLETSIVWYIVGILGKCYLGLTSVPTLTSTQGLCTWQELVEGALLTILQTITWMPILLAAIFTAAVFLQLAFIFMLGYVYKFIVLYCSLNLSIITWTIT